jgi:epoxyqueuosine reductase
VTGLAALAAEYGITHTGVTDAGELTRARAEIEQRKAAGMHDGMKFTFSNPGRSTNPRRSVHDARAAFVGARPYDLGAPTSGPGVRGEIARYAWTDHYAPLREGLRAVARQLRRDGYRAVAFADDNSMVDREVAYQAGIGWFGKNANILVPGLGSWFVLGSVVTTAPLPSASRTRRDGCGTCRVCIDACPTGAIVAEGVIDARRCLAWVLQKPGSIAEDMRAAIGARMYGCDDCQTTCPPNVRFVGKADVAVHGPLTPTVDVMALLSASDDEVMAVWGEWYLADRDPRWIRRNALVVLGNIADPHDPEVRAVLERYENGPDELLAEHARWARTRLNASRAAAGRR